MSDKFGRHKSTRWVKASVPSYGDEWGDEYDYDYGSPTSDNADSIPEDHKEDSNDAIQPINSNKSSEVTNNNEKSNSKSSGKVQHPPLSPTFGLNIYSKDGNESSSRTDFTSSTNEYPPLPNLGNQAPNNLVLSIDNLRTTNDDDDDESSDEELNSNSKQPFPKEESYEEEETFNFSPIDAPKNNVLSGTKTTTISDSTPSLPSSQTNNSPSLSSSPSKKPARKPLNIAISEKDAETLEEDSFLPPTPIFNTHTSSQSETPQSDLSYQSDADSIQFEPANLNVASPKSKQALSPEKDEKSHNDSIGINLLDKINSEERHLDVDKSTDNPTNVDDSIDSAHDVELGAGAPAPLVLSIDRQQNKDSDDEDDDDWGYNSEHSSNRDSDSLKITKSKETSRDSSERRQIKTDALDNLINDLEKASVGHDSESFTTQNNDEYDGSLLPNMSSIHDMSLPDFENRSFGDYSDKSNNLPPLDLDQIRAYQSESKALPESPHDDEFSNPPTPVAPLSYNDVKKGHENFLNDLSGHRPSIRKPPPLQTQVETRSQPQPQSQKPNIETTRDGLVSVDYSNIADAVSGYLNDDQKTINDNQGNARQFDGGNTNPRDSLGVDSFTGLKPSNSTGSLSTGKLSYETDNQSFKSSIRGVSNNSTDSLKLKQKLGDDNDEDIARRMSTMSTNTFNMGAWKPNTGNFRDQFINDNDNESQLNFNPYSSGDSASINNNYNKFTKTRNASNLSHSDVVSNSSSLSVPETIDVALPSINENHSDDDDETSDDDDDDYERHDETMSSNEEEKNLATSKTNDTLLNEHSYPQPLFKEEKMTPMASLESIPFPVDNNKHKSMLLDDSAVDISSQEKGSNQSRLVSASSDATTLSQSSAKNLYIQQPLPSYNWKQIMSTSQSIDRIRLYKEALAKEAAYDTGLLNWLNETLRLSEKASNMHVGKIASQAYQNATHNDIRRNISIRSKVSFVKDKVETSGLTASSFGKRFLNRGKKLMKSSGD